MGKMVNISEEERERRRANMLALQAEGKVGPQFGKLGGRPKKPRASTQVAERVASEGDKIYTRLMKIVEDGLDANSIKAATTLLKIEEQERQLDEKEVVNLEQAKRDELLEIVANGLKELEYSGILPGIIDGFVVDATDAEFEAVSASPASSEQTE